MKLAAFRTACLVVVATLPTPAALAQDRAVPAVFNDTRNIEYDTLQAAVADADPHDLIRILANRLVEHDIVVDKPMTILGKGPELTEIWAAGDGRCLDIETGDQLDEVRVIGVKLRQGRSKGANGGNVRVYNSRAVFERCRFEDGVAQFASGGALYAAVSLVILDRCVITNNTAEDAGAAYAPSTGLLLTNCIVSGNTATSAPCQAIKAGGVNVISMVNSTISNNGANAHPDGYLFENDFMVFLNNSIVWGNDAATFSPETDFLLLNASIIEGLDGVSGVLNADPLFVDPDNDDYRLSPGSPAIDAGWNEYLVDPHDQADFPTLRVSDAVNQFRFRDDPGTPDSGRQYDPNPELPKNTPIVDMGAIEFDAATPDACPADLAEPFGTLDFSDVFEFLTRFAAGCP